jgi:hypothetical protein
MSKAESTTMWFLVFLPLWGLFALNLWDHISMWLEGTDDE